MLSFPNCKINLGLHVVSKLADGYHAIETVFYPISWCDGLEVIENRVNSEAFLFSHSGLPISGPTDQNLIYKTWNLITQVRTLPPIQVHLHKNIPMGAGLGGGSSDAAFFINLVDSKFNLALSFEQKTEIAKQIGSDCAFFLKNEAVYAEGKGDQFSDIHVALNDYYILVVYPALHSNTKDAYSALQPKKPDHSLGSVIRRAPITEWRSLVVNDFESAIFKKYPAIASLKESLYEAGAIYASMSGSGSAVYGIFSKPPEIKLPNSFSFYLQKPVSKIL